MAADFRERLQPALGKEGEMDLASSEFFETLFILELHILQNGLMPTQARTRVLVRRC